MAADPQVLESLAFLYLAFGHGTDGTLTGEEMRSLADKLRTWAPEAELAEIGEVLKASVARYKASADKFADARQATTQLRGKLEGDQLKTILADLQAIAEADGEVSEREREFMAETAKAFGLV